MPSLPAAYLSHLILSLPLTPGIGMALSDGESKRVRWIGRLYSRFEEGCAYVYLSKHASPPEQVRSEEAPPQLPYTDLPGTISGAPLPSVSTQQGEAWSIASTSQYADLGILAIVHHNVPRSEQLHANSSQFGRLLDLFGTLMRNATGDSVPLGLVTSQLRQATRLLPTLLAVADATCKRQAQHFRVIMTTRSSKAFYARHRSTWTRSVAGSTTITT